MAKDLENYVADAIESFLAQEVGFAYEIVLSDDCSSDNTLSVCLEYQRQHPSKLRVLTSPVPQGLEENFIKTIRACSGKYIAFCDGDDYWTDTRKLEKQIQYLESNAGCSLVCSDYDYLKDGALAISTYKREHYGKRFSVYDDLNESIATTLTVVVRKAALEPLMAQLPPDNHPFIWDTVLWAWCLQQGWGFFLPEKTAVRRVLSTGSYTAKRLDERLHIQKRCLLSLKSLLPDEDVQGLLDDKLYANAVNTARALLQQNRKRDARKLLLRSLVTLHWTRAPRFKIRYLYHLIRTFA